MNTFYEHHHDSIRFGYRCDTLGRESHRKHSHRYRLLPQGYRICVVFLKLFERVYAPLTAGVLRPVSADTALPEAKRHRLDRLDQRIITDLDALWRAVGLARAA